MTARPSHGLHARKRERKTPTAHLVRQRLNRLDGPASLMLCKGFREHLEAVPPTNHLSPEDLPSLIRHQVVLFASDAAGTRGRLGFRGSHDLRWAVSTEHDGLTAPLPAWPPQRAR
jgi:hypothetical protein